MTANVSLLSTNLQGDPPIFYSATLLAFSLVLLAIVKINNVSPGKRFGPYIFRLLILLQIAVVIEDGCKIMDYQILAKPYEGEIIPVSVHYQKKYAGDTPGNAKYNMHITCKGTGKSLVLLDAGIPFASASFAGVVDRIARKFSNTTVCSYDRLGYGWSDKTTNSRTTLNMVNELRSLLAAAQQNNKRMIYIGWSFGGLVAQLYARLFTKEMLGLILVDSMDHHVLTDDTGLEAAINEGKFSFTLAKILTPIGFMRLAGFLGLLPPECGYPLSNTRLPKESEDEMRALFFSQSQFLDTAYDELDDLVYALNQSHDLLGTPERVPSNIPTIVLRSNLTVHAPYIKSHKRLLRLSERKVELITNNSDHYIPMRDPEAIVDALRALFILRKSLPKEEL